MPGHYTYPGVYVEEIPSGVRTITGVSTSDTAFVDFFKYGPVDKAVRITSFSDFERQFGGLDTRSEASYAIRQYYLNGGSVAWVVRVVASNARPAMRTLVSSKPGAYYGYGYGAGEFKSVLRVFAASPGTWGRKLQVAVDHKVSKPGDEFNLVVREVDEVGGKLQIRRTETYRNLSKDKSNPRFAVNVVNDASSLIRLEAAGAGELPEKNGEDVIGKPEEAEFLWLGQDGYQKGYKRELAKDEWKGKVEYKPGGDGHEPGTLIWNQSEGANALLGTARQGETPWNKGIYMLETIAPYIFNILCLPAVAKLSKDSRPTVLAEAATLCEDERAFLIVDIPLHTDTPVDTPAQMAQYMSGTELPSTNYAALYFPRVKTRDPLNEYRLREVGPSGTLAGVYARTDATRGVWKAPAGTDADLRGVELAALLTDQENGALNPLGINVLRNFPIYRNVSWGARTLEGADQQASEWKYIPIRRTALFIEESLYQGLKWVVFEPNDEPLWAQIRLNVGAFMHNLFRQGAFQGKTPREAYFVKCDKETTTQNDIDRGIVNIVVGFAPLKPAEFVVIKIQQIAGQIEV